MFEISSRPRRPEIYSEDQFFGEIKCSPAKIENAPLGLLVGLFVSMSDSSVMLIINDLSQLSIFPYLEYL